MEKHTKEKLKQLAKGVFADDKKAACYYADENATFLNEGQYASLSDEDKKAFVRIDNAAFEAEQVAPEAPVEETPSATEEAVVEVPEKKSNSKKAKS